ncbi:MAG: response regulator [Pseudomonadota bacterium]|nr:response regulator [Pseudomonadota bacterium]
MQDKAIRLLLIEDDKVDQMAFSRFVKSRNLPYDYTIASSVAETREVIRLSSFDVIIADYMLGDGTSFELFDQFAGVPVIVTTGSGNEDVAVEAMKLGACDYLIKDPEGCYFKTLPTTVELALKRKANEKALRNYHERLEAMVEERTVKLQAEIVERKQVEMKLRQSENKFRSMMEAMRDPVYICSDDYRVEYMNPAMITRVGPDAIGEFCYQALHGLEQPCPWCKKSGEQRGKYFELDIVSPKDSRSYHISHSPVVKEDGSVSSMIIFRDTTELKNLQSQLIQFQKMESIGTLAGGIAHDFNNILTSIYGYSEMAMASLEEGSSVWHDLHEIHKSGERAANLTRQLLAFSRKEVIMPKALKVNRLINDMQKMLSRLISEDIRLTTELDESVGAIYADPGQFEQVILNLVVNARDAVKNLSPGIEKNIRIITSQVLLDDDYVTTNIGSSSGWHLQLQVEDNGCGMAKEVVHRIFEPFYTTKGKGEGTGMGLATVYGIVKQNEGSVNVYSEPGQGTTFKIYWPIMAGEAAEAEVHKPEPARGGGEVILLAEDNRPIREIADRRLRKAGYTVIAAADGREALEKAAEHQGSIDLLFTDVVMPIMGGKELNEKIKALYPDISTLYSSGYIDSGVHQEILTLGKDHFINKPYNIRDLMLKIRRLLDEKKS